MKIVIINGQNHKGSTYKICRMLAEKVGGDITEFFLPKDFHEFCTGCTNCFMKDETLCPHYMHLEPIIEAMDEADLLIFGSPVYVMHATGPMKTFLDHLGYRFMVHRPEEKMFRKQAVCIATAAGSGVRGANKDMEDSLFFWGIGKIYKYGICVRAVSYDTISDKIKLKIEKKTDQFAKEIRKEQGKVVPSIRTKIVFYVMRHLGGLSEQDHAYWKEKNWYAENRPWL